MSAKHLWEVDHAYYCSENNYYSNECHFQFKSWQDFMDEMDDADLDYNLIFRWDWKENDPETDEPTYKGDDYYRNGRLYLFTMHQRKGRFVCSEIEVCRADESAVIEYLRPRLAHLMALWEPLTRPTTEEAKGE